MAMIISSNKGMALSIISVCPKVSGSNDPGKTALFMIILNLC